MSSALSAKKAWKTTACTLWLLHSSPFSALVKGCPFPKAHLKRLSKCELWSLLTGTCLLHQQKVSARLRAHFTCRPGAELQLSCQNWVCTSAVSVALFFPSSCFPQLKKKCSPYSVCYYLGWAHTLLLGHLQVTLSMFSMLLSGLSLQFPRGGTPGSRLPGRTGRRPQRENTPVPGLCADMSDIQLRGLSLVSCPVATGGNQSLVPCSGTKPAEREQVRNRKSLSLQGLIHSQGCKYYISSFRLTEL